MNIFVQKSNFLSVEICQLKLVRAHVNSDVRTLRRHAYARTYFAYARACRSYARYARAYDREKRACVRTFAQAYDMHKHVHTHAYSPILFL